ALGDEPADVIVGKTALRKRHPGPSAVLEELDGHERLSERTEDRLIDDSLRLDDLEVASGDGELTGSRDLHLLVERAADTKIHGDFAPLGVLAAGPLLELFRLRPVLKNGGPRGPEYPSDLHLLATDLCCFRGHGLLPFPDPLRAACPGHRS